MASQVPARRIHQHCAGCIRTDCTIPSDGERSCDIITCKYGCDQKYHECKDLDHKTHCEYLPVPCLNKEYGCTKVIPRRKLPEHLPGCPACVVLSADGQEMRRDEYFWYHKNVYEDLGGKDDLSVYEYCPCKSLGCDFKWLRIQPQNTSDFKVLKSDITGCIAVGNDSDTKNQPAIEKPRSDDLPSKNQGVMTRQLSEISSSSLKRAISVEGQETSQLICLPYDVLEKIVSYLDASSLNELSLTCCALREVCADCLEDKGMVVSRWKPGWKISHRVWKFSPCFAPIREWQYNGSLALGPHLQECPYMKGDYIVKHTEPFLVVATV